MTQSRLIDEVSGVGTTVAGGTLDIITATPPNDINTLLFAWVLASATGDERAFWLRGAAIHKTSGGVVTIDSETDMIPSFSTNGIKHASIAGVVSGANIILQCTGDAGGPNISWQAVVRFYRS